MALESGGRLLHPHTIQFNEAIGVAFLGLFVNLASAWLLRDDDDHHHHDHNLRAAYFHVLADAMTSVLAIIALFAVKFWGWVWMDAAMGLVGAGVITRWAYGLVKDTSVILLDGAVDKKIQLDILTILEADADNRVTDLHIWYLNQEDLAATISLVTHFPQEPEYYKKLLSSLPSLTHLIVEVNPCQGEPCLD
jgi:cation diffusion facilitator family transporter